MFIARCRLALIGFSNRLENLGCLLSYCYAQFMPTVSSEEGSEVGYTVARISFVAILIALYHRGTSISYNLVK